MIERWLPIAGYADYEVSSLGRVRRARDAKTGARAGLILKPWRSASGKGYLTVTLCGQGRKPRFAVHRLVCTAFHGEQPTPEHEVAHGDGDLLNCAESNLRWATPAENHADKIAHRRTNRGERHGLSKLTDAEAAYIRQLPTGRGTGRRIARQFGVSESLICMIRNGRIRTSINPTT